MNSRGYMFKLRGKLAKYRIIRGPFAGHSRRVRGLNFLALFHRGKWGVSGVTI
jgi:hypothetical protein